MNTLQVLANAIRTASRGFSDSTSHGDMFRRVADEVEKEARRLPDFNNGVAVSQDLLDKTHRR